jgi:hypothetical protein
VTLRAADKVDVLELTRLEHYVEEPEPVSGRSISFTEMLSMVMLELIPGWRGSSQPDLVFKVEHT